MSTKRAYFSVRDTDWNVWQNDDQTYSYDSIKIVLLMDIRAELQKLNAVLGCSNFQAIPTRLERIARNTAKPRPKKRT